MERPVDQEIILSPPDPHSKKQRLAMTAFKIPAIREIWIACGTKWGKTLAGSGAMIVGGVDRPGTKWRWVAPIHDQARIAMEDYFPKILPPEPHRKQNLADLTFKIPAVDVTFEFWHAQNPGSLEGAAVNGYVFDEAAKMKPEVRASARTTTTRTQGPHMYISYPQGKNWFHTGCMEAKEHMEWSLKNGVPPEKIFIHAPTSDNPYISKKVIEDARREIPDRLFRQFYLAEFVSDGQIFTGFRDRQFGPELDHLYGERQFWVDDQAAEADVVIGVDWAKTVDWTVFIAADVKTRRVIGLERFHKVPYTEAIRRLILFSRKFKSVLTIRHDKTGVGSAIDDQLAQTNLPYEGIVFTNPSKSEMVTKLMTSFEKTGELYIPRWNVLLGELDAFDVTTNALGTPIYSAPSGKHDDTIAALMLMNTALIDYGERDYQIKFLEDMPNQKPGVLEQFYRDLASDEDD